MVKKSRGNALRKLGRNYESNVYQSLMTEMFAFLPENTRAEETNLFRSEVGLGHCQLDILIRKMFPELGMAI